MSVVQEDALLELLRLIERGRAIAKLTAESSDLMEVFAKMQSCLALQHTLPIVIPQQAQLSRVPMLEMQVRREKAKNARLESVVTGKPYEGLRVGPTSDEALPIEQNRVDKLNMKLDLVTRSEYASIPAMQISESAEAAQNALRHIGSILPLCRPERKYLAAQDSTMLYAESAAALVEVMGFPLLLLQLSMCFFLCNCQ
jgi:hypothetical protein